MEQKQNLAFISLDENRKNNLHLTVGLLSFVWMVFHFAVVFFFVLQLESVLLVGLFLGLGNLFAFLLDIPIGILQYYFKSKTLYIMGAVSQMVALIIFANFIFQFTTAIASPVVENAGFLESVLGLFLFDGVNLILLIIACFCYGFTKEINDITTISYVLNNASPSQYKTVIAKNNLFFGIGGFLGLMTSGVILSFAPEFIITSLIFIIIFILFVTTKLFDNSRYTLKFSDIERFKVFFDRDGLGKIKNNILQSVNRIELGKVVGQTKYIFLRPLVIKKEMISFKDIIIQTKKSFKDIYETLKYAFSSNLVVYWAFSMVLTFGFWDTFATTFLIDFLDKIKHGYSYVLLGIIAVPAFGLQEFFGKLADRIGVYKIANFGLLLSGSSLIIMSFFASSNNLNAYILIGLALVNSVGYAICMSLSVATFLEVYNKSYAEKQKLVEIDANASAAPLKILQNLANVIGLSLGGLILMIFDYSGFFFVFGAMIIGLLLWSIFKRSKINV